VSSVIAGLKMYTESITWAIIPNDAAIKADIESSSFFLIAFVFRVKRLKLYKFHLKIEYCNSFFMNPAIF
jgi:hypothetical protein